MLPSALPAFSAPNGVRLVPSLAASSADTAAITWVASRLRASTPVCRRIFVVFIRSSSSLSPARRPGSHRAGVHQKFMPKLSATKSRSSTVVYLPSKKLV
ncbi:Uncharacterised protein [Acinetobacter baumannii]|nr:Uncharacterised protein [Acinetobacter baumannii]